MMNQCRHLFEFMQQPLKPQTDIISMASRPTLSTSSLDDSSVLQRQPASRVDHKTSRETVTQSCQDIVTVKATKRAVVNQMQLTK